ncbi:MAG: GTP-binding protein [Oscillibacter sp.]|nr:GTP-binding protein [Oscillibacter sp.]
MSKLWEPNPDYDPSEPQSWDNKPYKRLYDELTPEELAELLRDAEEQQWKTLDLSNTQIQEVPDSIGNLTSLEKLGLYDTQIREVPETITRLSSLQTLDLCGTQIWEVPETITRLSSLQTLDLSFTKINEVPETITRLSSLQVLSLNNTQIQEVPETITRLSSLQTLYLSNTDISEVPETITRLSSLQSLDLSYTQIREVPETITRLSSLQTLYLRGTQIQEVPETITRLSSLQTLYLSYTKIREVPETITRLSSLQLLDLSDCHLKAIPYALVKLGLPFVIDNDTAYNCINLTGVELDEGDLQLFAQPRDVIEAAYLEQVRVRECKVIFLGDGAAGKSSLIQRMVHGDFDPAKLPTDGVKTTKWETPLLNLPFMLRILDFGGQEIMHSMHRCFLTAHTVYVVVCESRDDADIDNEAARWLETVKAFAPDCPVILALNKCDLNANVSVNERDLKERNPKLKCVLKTSAKEKPEDRKYGVNRLMSAILDEIPGALNRYKVNADMLGIKQTLEDMKDDYISSERYREICAEHHITDAALQYSLLGFFRDLGVAYYYESNAFDTRLESVRVLNPQWLTNGIYRLILRTPESGFLSHKTIKDTLRDGYAGDVHSEITYTPEETEYILHVMRYFEISHDMGNGVEMIPLKMPKTPPPTLDNFNRQNALHLRWEGAYLPNNLIHRLLIRKFPELDRDCVWRTGGHFVQEGGGCEALAEMNEKALNVYVNGERDCRQYLETFRRVIQAILTILNLKVSEVICCTVDGQEGAVPYEDVVQQYYDKRDEIYIPGIHKYVNPAALLRDTYYNWEQEAARYCQRDMFRAPEPPEKSELDDEKTRAEIAQINADTEKSKSETKKNNVEADKTKVEITKMNLGIKAAVAAVLLLAFLIWAFPDVRHEFVEALISLLTGLL